MTQGLADQTSGRGSPLTPHYARTNDAVEKLARVPLEICLEQVPGEAHQAYPIRDCMAPTQIDILLQALECCPKGKRIAHSRHTLPATLPVCSNCASSDTYCFKYALADCFLNFDSGIWKKAQRAVTFHSTRCLP